MSEEKQYKPGTIESILEDRLSDVMHHKIGIDEFPALVIADIIQDLKCDVRAAPALMDACKTLLGNIREVEALTFAKEVVDQAEAAIALAEKGAVQ